jgi:type I restriction enzyme, R subunit
MIKDNEQQFETDIISWLTSSNGGWELERFKAGDYDAVKALDLPKLIRYIKQTQPKKWERYQKLYAQNPADALYKRLEEEITAHGMLYVLRNGITDRGVKFKLVSFKPVSKLNKQVTKDYAANLFTCTRQFAYSARNHNTIDLVLSVNGIPLVALELKNQIKGQTVEHAKKQFMFDRDPTEPMLKFNHRVLVYFAVDLYEAWMTTKLAKEKTYFLPFNQGSNGAGNVGGKGNPAVDDGYATAYLWKNVLQRDKLMDILHRFMNLEVKEEVENGKKSIKKTLIFPRYHQLDVVTKLVDDVRKEGTGQHYLIQHSAGSGKSNSIAWLAYHLQSIHNDADVSMFDSVVIVTDRTVLDRQLQNTITSFDHQTGLVETIDDRKSSKDLLVAINDGKRIIITTLQKFPIIYKDVDASKKKRFAVIVDEAHSSQTGASAQKLKTALADKEAALCEWQAFDEEMEAKTPDDQDEMIQTLLSQGRHTNISFFAFTATPKAKTLELFGVKQEDGSFAAFHVYSMCQAIEEGFILDVLQNYMTYHTAYKIAKEIPDDPELPESAAKRAIRRYESLHPYNLSQKTAVMIEMFREKTRHEIGGKGKAMVVTSSRLHAVRYMLEFRDYIKRKGYTDLDVLVAFSGEVKDDGETYTESGMNQTKDGMKIKENQLKEAFHSPDFHVLIVAEKYQTGFDEPLLHTMFVDKRLRGVKAVQTLSRLNRTTMGKSDTFVLDFVNTAEEIQKSFQPYYEATMLDNGINVNTIYDTRKTIHKYLVYNEDDIGNVMALYQSGEGDKQDSRLLGKLSSLFKPIISRYEQLDQSQQYDYRVLLRKFSRLYNYITQLTRFFDKDLLSEYIFLGYLLSFIPKESQETIDLTDKVRMEYYKLRKDWAGKIMLVRQTSDPLKTPESMQTGAKPPEAKNTLKAIIEKINQQFPDDFTDDDRVVYEMIFREIVPKADQRQRNMARNNDFAMFAKSLFPREFADKTMGLYEGNMQAFGKFFGNQEIYNFVMSMIAKEAYRQWRSDEVV